MQGGENVFLEEKNATQKMQRKAFTAIFSWDPVLDIQSFRIFYVSFLKSTLERLGTGSQALRVQAPAGSWVGVSAERTVQTTKQHKSVYI